MEPCVIRNPRAITAATFLAMFFLGVGYSLVGAAARGIGLSPVEIGLLLGVQNLGFGIAVAVAGALSDTHSKARVIFVGSLLLAASLIAFYAVPHFWINLIVMLFIGAGIGAYEGSTDALLFDLHETRAGLYVTVNHLFVTLGSLVISTYLLFLALRWRAAVVQAGLVVAVLAVFFVLARVPAARRGQASLGGKLRAIAGSRFVAILFLCTLLSVGAQSSTIGLLSTFLAELRGLAPVASKVGLVIFLVGIAAGRIVVGFFVRPQQLRRAILVLFGLSVVAFALLYLVELGPLTLPTAFLAGLTLSSQLPLILTYAGLAFRDMTGTVLGAIKIAIPMGGVLIPPLVSAASRAASFQAGVAIIPASLLAAALLLGVLDRSPGASAH